MSILFWFLRWLGYAWVVVFVLILSLFVYRSYVEYKRKRDNKCINCVNYDSRDSEICAGCKYLQEKEYLNKKNYHHKDQNNN